MGYTVDATGQPISDTSGTTYTCDAAGNLTGTSDGESYTYDDYGRHVSISAGGVTQTYGYDAANVRVTVDGQTQLWDRNGGLPTLISTSNGDNYVHTAGIARDGDGWLLADAVGSVRTVVDNTGATTGSQSFTAFGEQLTGSGTFGFAGEQHDPTGLQHLRARQYNPALGRFTTVDPVQPGAPGTTGYNLYAYSGNNPTTWTDPSGMLVEDSLIRTSVAGRTGAAAGGTGLLVASIFALAYSGIECTAELTTVGGEFLPGPCSFFDFDREDEMSDVLEYEDEENDPTKGIQLPEPDLTCSDAYPDQARATFARNARETGRSPFVQPNQTIAIMVACDPTTLVLVRTVAGQRDLSATRNLTSGKSQIDMAFERSLIPIVTGTDDHAERKALAGINSADPFLEELAIGTSVNICGGNSADCLSFLQAQGAEILPPFGGDLGSKGAIWPAR